MGFWDFDGYVCLPSSSLDEWGIACIVVDDDLERLQEIRKDLEEAERELWDKTVVEMLDRTFFFVGTWKEEDISLVVSLVHIAHYQALPQDFERWAAPGNLWTDILELLPILSHYQELAHSQEGSAPLLGARLFHRNGLPTPYYRFTHFLTLIVPFIWSPRALMFANDFAAQYSTISLVANSGTKYEASVEVVKMGPPALKDEGLWDGPFLRNDKWKATLDSKFTEYVE